MSDSRAPPGSFVTSVVISSLAPASAIVTPRFVTSTFAPAGYANAIESSA
jgi:hypothetical protein